ncbi:MAG: GAF domain-containing protein [Zymomonas mobilis]|uniref:GAF domain-containing protein n=1 Tax=Zymomonas mobilis TaxID=542 RepID=A0A542W071_ZYMMB|nr:GAF domain-containing protein [Zymomonas mobilis]TQL16982.1 GAF domain-containing protein [Zymomonas mobilis]
MFSFSINTGSKKTLYSDLLVALKELLSEEGDPVANMANTAALLWTYIPDLNWVGFYQAIRSYLILGPFQGKVACVKIPYGRGVCGTAAATGRIQCVRDVHVYPGHISCDPSAASELVIPIRGRQNQILAVIDLESPTMGRFDTEDVEGCSRLMEALGPFLG